MVAPPRSEQRRTRSPRCALRLGRPQPTRQMRPENVAHGQVRAGGSSERRNGRVRATRARRKRFLGRSFATPAVKTSFQSRPSGRATGRPSTRRVRSFRERAGGSRPGGRRPTRRSAAQGSAEAQPAKPRCGAAQRSQGRSEPEASDRAVSIPSYHQCARDGEPDSAARGPSIILSRSSRLPAPSGRR